MTDIKKDRILTGSNLIGSQVLNPQQEKLGTIEDLAIDPFNGNIIYAVMSFGGFMGFGEKLFAMPWQAFYLDTKQDETVILDIDKKKLADAPGLQNEELPVEAQWDFIDKTYRYYGFKEYTLRRPVGRSHRAPSQERSPLSKTGGLGNSGKVSTFKEAGFDSNRIKETGIN